MSQKALKNKSKVSCSLFFYFSQWLQKYLQYILNCVDVTLNVVVLRCYLFHFSLDYMYYTPKHVGIMLFIHLWVLCSYNCLCLFCNSWTTVLFAHESEVLLFGAQQPTRGINSVSHPFFYTVQSSKKWMLLFQYRNAWKECLCMST